MRRFIGPLRGQSGGINATVGAASATALAVVALGVAAIAGPIVTGGSGSSCTGSNVTTSTLSSRLGSASPGDTLCLAAGTYTWASTTKTSPGVTVEPVAGAAVTFNAMTLNGSTRATWITFDGSPGSGGTMNFKGLELCAPNTHLTWNHTTWNNGQITIRQDGTAGACGGSGSMIGSSILFENSTFENYNASGLEGTIHFPGPDAAGAIGVTIQDNLFLNNLGDGIQDGVNGVQILDNEFTGMLDCGCGPHTDSVQLYGSTDTLVQGNWFHNDTDGIVEFDCCQTDDVIKDNVIGPSLEHHPLALYDSTGEQVTHNTVAAGGGDLELGANNGGSGSSGALLRDNIMDGVNVVGSNTGLTSDHNLCASGCGAGNTTGSPTYVGGTTPSTRAGYALTTGSLGHLGASDGTDIGANP